MEKETGIKEPQVATLLDISLFNEVTVLAKPSPRRIYSLDDLNTDLIS